MWAKRSVGTMLWVISWDIFAMRQHRRISISPAYNGEWLRRLASMAGELAFNLEGWEAHNGADLFGYADAATTAPSPPAPAPTPPVSPIGSPVDQAK
jgi:hypothetical protein